MSAWALLYVHAVLCHCILMCVKGHAFACFSRSGSLQSTDLSHRSGIH